MKKSILLALMGAAICANAQETPATPFYLMKGNNVVAAYTTADVDAIDFEAQEPEEAPFSLTVTPGLTTASVSVTPVDDEMLYMVYVLGADKVLPILSAKGPEGIYDRDVAWYQWMVDLYGGTWQQYMTQELSKGPYVHEQESLSYDTDYYAYVYGVNEDCELITEVYLFPFKTLSLETVDVTFTITLDSAEATGKFKGNASLSITPDNDELPWYTFLYTSTNFERMLQTSTIPEIVREVTGSIDYYTPSYGAGTYTSSNLVPGRRYYMLTFVYDPEAQIISAGTIFTFTEPTYVAPAE